jgi:hypothetical protein
VNDLVQSAIRGDPEAALLWVSKSQRHLSAALADLGFSAGQRDRPKYGGDQAAMRNEQRRRQMSR